MIPLILLIFPAIYLLFLIVIILSGKYIILLPVLLMLFSGPVFLHCANIRQNRKFRKVENPG